MDPSERLDFVARFDGSLLERGEEIADFTVELLPEATALGLAIVEGQGLDPRLVEGGVAIQVWFEVAPEFRQDSAFNGKGVTVGCLFTLITDSDPPRTRQRTYSLQVLQQ